MKTLLFTAHTPSENTEKLATICAAEMQSCSDNVTLIHKAPLETVSADGLNCDGLVIATTENIGYMAGLSKDMFDRCYNDWLYHTDGLPVAFYIRAGLDGTATATTLSRFAHALRWRMVRPPLILKGDYIKDFETQAAELGGGFCCGSGSGHFLERYNSKMRLISMAAEIAPLAALFIGNAVADIFVGAQAAVGCAAVIIVYNRVAERRWAAFALFSVLVSAVFTATALLFGDSLFIKIQPSLFNGLFCLILLGGWVRGQAVMKLFFGAQFSLTLETWRSLSLRWGCFSDFWPSPMKGHGDCWMMMAGCGLRYFSQPR